MKSKKVKTRKISITRLQSKFNKMIVERDIICQVRDGKNFCAGQLQASHFFPVGANSVLRFYPFNCFCQCAGHHFAHHNRDPLFYAEWIKAKYSDELEFMRVAKNKTIKYNQVVLTVIDRIITSQQSAYLRSEELARYIRRLLNETV